MPKIFKKLFLIFLCFLTIVSANLSLLASSVKAQESTWYNQSYTDWFTKVYSSSESPENEIFGERYTAAQVQWVLYGLIANVINIVSDPNIVSCVMAQKGAGDLGPCADLIKPVETSVNSQQKDKNLAQLVFSGHTISGITYIKERVGSFKLIPEANAQTPGFGFDALKPVQDMWKASRNIAFGLFILITIVFAFMIMFRVKINPQTVISVQSSIPKIVTALVLVTFSYAIAGFLIDLMYVVIGILSVMLRSFVPIVQPTAANVFSQLTLGNPLQTVGINVNTGILGLVFIYLSPLIIILFMLTIAGIFLSPLTGSLSFWIPMIILVIVAIVGIWIALKTTWALLKAFVSVLLLTIFAPLQISLGVLVPNFGFGQWVKSYLSQLSVFVVTGVLFFLSIIFLAQGAAIGAKGLLGGALIATATLTPLVGGNVMAGLVGAGESLYHSTTWPPLLSFGGGNIGTGILFVGVSFVLFTLIPKATEIVQGFISGKPFAYGTAIGEAVAPLGWGKQQFIDPITGSYKQAAGRKAVLASQKQIGGWIQRREMAGKRFPQFVKDFLEAPVGEE